MSFIGTYAPTPLAKDDQSNLFLGAGNKLYWPNVENYKVNAFRAYFHVDLGTSSVRSYNLSFGDSEDNTTGIVSMEDLRGKMSDAWYDLNGRKLDGKPTRAGLNIHNGIKVVIK